MCVLHHIFQTVLVIVCFNLFQPKKLASRYHYDFFVQGCPPNFEGEISEIILCQKLRRKSLQPKNSYKVGNKCSPFERGSSPGLRPANLKSAVYSGRSPMVMRAHTTHPLALQHCNTATKGSAKEKRYKRSFPCLLCCVQQFTSASRTAWQQHATHHLPRFKPNAKENNLNIAVCLPMRRRGTYKMCLTTLHFH